MIYTQEQMREHVRGLQSDLRVLGLAGEIAPLVPISGIYDEATRAAVIDFQRRHGLAVTGTVDLTTWNAIVMASNRARLQFASPIPARIFPKPDTVLRLGDRGWLVTLVQVMLDSLSPHFDLPRVPQTGTYDEDTAHAVRHMQRAAGLSPTGELDRQSWDHLAGLYNNYAHRAPLIWTLSGLS